MFPATPRRLSHRPGGGNRCRHRLPKSSPRPKTSPTTSPRPTFGHAGRIADGLVLERLPNDTYAWLKPWTEPAEDDDALDTITEAGRRALRMAELFGTEG
jgi:hypothetical protein